MLFPSGSTVPPPVADMPTGAVELYDEAREVAGVSRRAGAGMARTTLDYLLRKVLPEVGITIPHGTRLDGIMALAEAEVSSGLAQRLNLVRHAGNKSVHVEDVPDDVMVLVLDPEDDAIMDILSSTINDLVDELITKRRQSAEMYDLLPEGVRQSIERKRQQNT